MNKFLSKFFKLEEKGTTVRVELIAGLTTFMAMAYILMVNPGMFADPFGDGTNVLGVSFGAIYIATEAICRWHRHRAWALTHSSFTRFA